VTTGLAEDRVGTAVSALDAARVEVARLRDAVTRLTSAMAARDTGASCLAAEELRAARRDAEAALRLAQEAADLAIDATVPVTTGTRPVTGVVRRVRS
jgi:hypothetical protein